MWLPGDRWLRAGQAKITRGEGVGREEKVRGRRHCHMTTGARPLLGHVMGGDCCPMNRHRATESEVGVSSRASRLGKSSSVFLLPGAPAAWPPSPALRSYIWVIYSVAFTDPYYVPGPEPLRITEESEAASGLPEGLGQGRVQTGHPQADL